MIHLDTKFHACSSNSSLCTTLKLKAAQYFRTDVMFYILTPTPKKYVSIFACFNVSVQVPVLSCANFFPFFQAHVSAWCLWSYLKILPECLLLLYTIRYGGCNLWQLTGNRPQVQKIFRNLEHMHSHSQTHGLNCTLRCTLCKVGESCTEVWKFVMKQSTVVTEFVYLSQSHYTPNPHKLHFDCMLTSNLSESEPTDTSEGRIISRQDTKRHVWRKKKRRRKTQRLKEEENNRRKLEEEETEMREKIRRREYKIIWSKIRKGEEIKCNASRRQEVRKRKFRKEN